MLCCVPLRRTVLTFWLCTSDQLDHIYQLFVFNQHVPPPTASFLPVTLTFYCLDSSPPNPGPHMLSLCELQETHSVVAERLNIRSRADLQLEGTASQTHREFDI